MTQKPYTGPFKIINIDIKEPMNYLQEQMFVNAPCCEPFDVSLRRLIAVLRADGIDEIRPLTIWSAYRRHKELSYPI